MRSYNMLGINDEMSSIISDFPEEFDIEIEDKFYSMNDLSGMIERVMQEYSVELDDTELSSRIYVFNTPIKADEILMSHDTISPEDYREVLGNRNPAGKTRILYFVPEGNPHKPFEYDQEELDLIERFNDELEFLAMSDGKDNFGGTYMHVFDLTD